ncbi:hypothetical protein FEM48_Zijuj06G0151600 [Ziziphus jujuba var. spinosa]|uniref:GPI mannosyltransferase 2 n=1 Tax=Ziziphus jujuba var. spinosa TaxID=714518 RepID=A0A978VA06_ZIZJJ|nr:hypothetical protein FEM48_Zijuj06G0151600 [Ziziphus jujuba var. spinosa]
MDVKSKETSKLRTAKHDPKPDLRASTPRKSTSSERLPSKEENKIQISAKPSKEENKVQISWKKVTANGSMDDQDRSNKQRISVGKKSSGDLVNSGIPGNLVKVPLNNKKLTEGSVSWASLPSSLAKLGKLAMQVICGGALRSICIFAPFVTFQAYGYCNICLGHPPNEMRPWCKARVPLLYNYIQSY